MKHHVLDRNYNPQYHHRSLKNWIFTVTRVALWYWYFCVFLGLHPWKLLPFPFRLHPVASCWQRFLHMQHLRTSDTFELSLLVSRPDMTSCFNSEITHSATVKQKDTVTLPVGFLIMDQESNRVRISLFVVVSSESRPDPTMHWSYKQVLWINPPLKIVPNECAVYFCFSNVC